MNVKAHTNGDVLLKNARTIFVSSVVETSRDSQSTAAETIAAAAQEHTPKPMTVMSVIRAIRQSHPDFACSQHIFTLEGIPIKSMSQLYNNISVIATNDSFVIPRVTKPKYQQMEEERRRAASEDPTLDRRFNYALRSGPSAGRSTSRPSAMPGGRVDVDELIAWARAELNQTKPLLRLPDQTQADEPLSPTEQLKKSLPVSGGGGGGGIMAPTNDDDETSPINSAPRSPSAPSPQGNTQRLMAPCASPRAHMVSPAMSDVFRGATNDDAHVSPGLHHEVDKRKSPEKPSDEYSPASDGTSESRARPPLSPAREEPSESPATASPQPPTPALRSPKAPPPKPGVLPTKQRMMSPTGAMVAPPEPATDGPSPLTAQSASPQTEEDGETADSLTDDDGEDGDDNDDTSSSKANQTHANLDDVVSPSSTNYERATTNPPPSAVASPSPPAPKPSHRALIQKRPAESLLLAKVRELVRDRFTRSAPGVLQEDLTPDRQRSDETHAYFEGLISSFMGQQMAVRKSDVQGIDFRSALLQALTKWTDSVASTSRTPQAVADPNLSLGVVGPSGSGKSVAMRVFVAEAFLPELEATGAHHHTLVVPLSIPTFMPSPTNDIAFLYSSFVHHLAELLVIHRPFLRPTVQAIETFWKRAVTQKGGAVAQTSLANALPNALPTWALLFNRIQRSYQARDYDDFIDAMLHIVIVLRDTMNFTEIFYVIDGFEFLLDKKLTDWRNAQSVVGTRIEQRLATHLSCAHVSFALTSIVSPQQFFPPHAATSLRLASLVRSVADEEAIALSIPPSIEVSTGEKYNVDVFGGCPGYLATLAAAIKDLGELPMVSGGGQSEPLTTPGLGAKGYRRADGSLRVHDADVSEMLAVLAGAGLARKA